MGITALLSILGLILLIEFIIKGLIGNHDYPEEEKMNYNKKSKDCKNWWNRSGQSKKKSYGKKSRGSRRRRARRR
tara:strand:- start:4301 stop:4525 length:225 start_codon:yes stop_codon:yes gene_type:complete